MKSHEIIPQNRDSRTLNFQSKHSNLKPIMQCIELGLESFCDQSSGLKSISYVDKLETIRRGLNVLKKYGLDPVPKIEKKDAQVRLSGSWVLIRQLCSEYLSVCSTLRACKGCSV
jgi:hypothetical protein